MSASNNDVITTNRTSMYRQSNTVRLAAEIAKNFNAYRGRYDI